MSIAFCGSRRRGSWLAATMLMFITCGYLSGCALVFDAIIGCTTSLVITGRVLDATTMSGATDAILGIRVSRDDDPVDRIVRPEINGTPLLPPPEADGTFVIHIGNTRSECLPRKDPFPKPDRVTITVLRGSCAQEITVEITDETTTHHFSIEGDARTDTYTLTDPILVSPCEE